MGGGGGAAPKISTTTASYSLKLAVEFGGLFSVSYFGHFRDIDEFYLHFKLA